MTTRRRTPSTPPPRSVAWVVACVLALVGYLGLPGVHAVHVPACTPTAPHADHHHDHAHGGHVHGHAHEHDGEDAPPCHDPSDCDVCRLYAATSAATHAAAPVALELPSVAAPARVLAAAPFVPVSHPRPEWPARGPPA